MRNVFPCINPVFPNLSSVEESLKLFFISRGTPTYENVYRPEKLNSGERNSITAKLLSIKFIWHRARLSVATGEAAL
jgi:hypothetical protein